MALSTWLPLVARSSHDLHVDNPLGGCRKRDTRSHAPDSAVPTFDIERVRRCLLDPRKQRRALGGCGRERASIGVIAKPRNEESRRSRRHDCIAREMRKPNRATRTAAGALLLFCGLRLLVRHGCGSRVDCLAVNVGDRRIVRLTQCAEIAPALIKKG